MATLKITIEVELDVPDDWEMVETSEGIHVLKIANNQYLDFTFEPMVTDNIEGDWSNSVDDDFMNDLIDMVESEEVSYEVLAS